MNHATWGACAMLTPTVLGLALFVSSARERPRFQEEVQSAVTEEKTPLLLNMELLRDGLQDIRRDLSDATRLSERLELVVRMQSAAKASKTMPFPLAEEQPEGERAGFVLAYRKEMILVEEELLHLERAILDSDLPAAKESYKKLKQMEEDGHARFSEDG